MYRFARPGRVLREGGFLLQEALLALVLVSLVIAMALPFVDDANEVTKAQEDATDLKLFQQVAQDYLLANKAAYVSAMTDGTGAASLCLINVNPVDGTGGTQANDTALHTCAFDTAFLRWKALWPSERSLNNSLRERWVALAKLEYDSGSPPAPTGGISLLAVSASVSGTPTVVVEDAKQYSRMTTASLMLEGTGGVVPDTDRVTCKAVRSTATYEACGGSWRIALSDYITAASLTAFGNRLPN